jgi:hypothetical protein
MAMMKSRRNYMYQANPLADQAFLDNLCLVPDPDKLPSRSVGLNTLYLYLEKPIANLSG